MARIESLLAARLFVAPQLVNHRIYFISNLSGHLSLYAMDFGGSVPEPLLPPHIALQNPDLITGQLFAVFPQLNKIMVIVDRDGDENYQPMVIPLSGGFPEPAFGDELAAYRVNLLGADKDNNIAYLWAQAQQESLSRAYRADLAIGELLFLGESTYGAFPMGHNAAHNRFILGDGYGVGDNVLYIKDGDEERRLLFGIPLEKREPGQEVPPSSLGQCHFVNDGQGLLFTTSLFSDTYGLGYLELADPAEARPVTVTGEVHTGLGEMEDCEHIAGNRFLLEYNIDGCSWLYEGTFDPAGLTMTLNRVLCGRDTLSDGVLKGYQYDEVSDQLVLSFTTATSPTQIYTVSRNQEVQCHTRERVLGLPDGVLSPGEDASFTSHDGLRISARLYLPDESLGYEPPYPLTYYIHGGPTSQEHPDFAWFSMPLIQFLTLNGIAVFVPNVRGSTGYGFEYMNRVVHDWGGQDRLDHVHAMTQVLSKDERLDTGRAGVVGRSYGGYMTLTLASRHPELWSAAVDMFGPYNMLTFADRVPETWKPYIAWLVGDPETEQDFLLERSPSTYIHQIQCPLLVIQGKNDPRVWEQESRELVEDLRDKGKVVEYLMFEDEGHDVLKFENRVRCYNAITDFFKTHLQVEEADKWPDPVI